MVTILNNHQDEHGLRLKTPAVLDLEPLVAASWGGPEAFREGARVIEMLRKVRTVAIVTRREGFQCYQF